MTQCLPTEQQVSRGACKWLASTPAGVLLKSVLSKLAAGSLPASILAAGKFEHPHTHIVRAHTGTHLGPKQWRQARAQPHHARQHAHQREPCHAGAAGQAKVYEALQAVPVDLNGVCHTLPQQDEAGALKGCRTCWAAQHICQG
jgi:hypothetical protein